MITSEGKVGRFIIATPTKCGTTTLEEMCRRHRGGRAGEPVDTFRIMDWEKPRRQHGMVPPEGWDAAARFIMVRNPYDRWVSVYEYLLNPANYSKWGAKEIQGSQWRGKWAYGEQQRLGSRPPMNFLQFVEFVIQSRREYASGRWANKRGPFLVPFHYRSPWVWLDRLDESALKLRNQSGFNKTTDVLWSLRLENFWDGMELLKDWYGLADLSVRRSIHANRSLRRKDGVGGPTYWGGMVSCGQHVTRGEGEGMLAAGKVWDRCGICPACRLGVDVEARALGYVMGESPKVAVQV